MRSVSSGRRCDAHRQRSVRVRSLTYATPTVPPSARDESLGDPRGIAWRSDGTRAFVTAILNGTLAGAKFTPDDVFGLMIPDAVPGVPSEVLRPKNTWADPAAYDAKAKDLAGRFRANDGKYDITDAVRAAGPMV